MLSLAREQKVDLARLSILALAEQYLAFIETAQKLDLDLAASWLVMACWLAYLKSRLLLPAPEDDGEAPDAASLAAALQFQLQRLDAMRTAADRLFAGNLLGRDLFPRGMPEGLATTGPVVCDASLYDLLAAWGTMCSRAESTALRIEPADLYAAEDGLGWLRHGLETAVGWTDLRRFLPPPDRDPLRRRSAAGAALLAGLELARLGEVRLRQDRAFGPVYVRRHRRDQGGQTQNRADQNRGATAETDSSQDTRS